jgi:hypothetical protein
MATIPTLTDFTAQEKVLASKLNANTTQALRFLLDPPKCIVYYTNGSNTLLANTSFTDIPMGGEAVDNDNMHSTTTNAQRITINTPGTYLLHGMGNFGNTSAGSARVLQIKKNDLTTVAYQLNVNLPLTAIFGVSVVCQLVAGDWVTLQGWHNQGSGLTLSMTNGLGNTQFAAHWLSV